MKWLFAIAAMTGPLVFSGEPKFRVVENNPADTDRKDSSEMLDDKRLLKVGDRISMRIVEDKGKTQSVLVQASGDIQCPHLGLIKAEGLTAKALAASIKTGLEKSYFEKATVIVALERAIGVIPSQPAPRFPMIIGQGNYVISPGEKMTVSRAMLRLGGLTERERKCKIIRKRKTAKEKSRSISGRYSCMAICPRISKSSMATRLFSSRSG